MPVRGISSPSVQWEHVTFPGTSTAVPWASDGRSCQVRWEIGLVMASSSRVGEVGRLGEAIPPRGRARIDVGFCVELSSSGDSDPAAAGKCLP